MRIFFASFFPTLKLLIVFTSLQYGTEYGGVGCIFRACGDGGVGAAIIFIEILGEKFCRFVGRWGLLVFLRNRTWSSTMCAVYHIFFFLALNYFVSASLLELSIFLLFSSSLLLSLLYSEHSFVCSYYAIIYIPFLLSLSLHD